MQDSTPGQAGRLDWLDYGRVLCAMFVLLDHYLVVAINGRIANGITSYGMASEVARFGTISLFVFLMMSGMMITIVAQRQSAATFVTHRFARIYPMLVLGMTITALVSQFGPEQLRVSLTQYLVNLFLIDSRVFGYRFVDAVYWTLIIEFIFYAAVLAVMMTGAIRRLQTVVTVWIALQLACVALPWRLPLIGIDYYFLGAGAVMALLYQRRNERWNLMLLAVSLLLCLRCAVDYARSFGFDATIASVVTVLIFAFFLLMRGRDLKLPFARRLGSMTYALYLLHFKIGMIIFYWTIDEANKYWVVVGVTLGMIAVSFAIDEVVEFRLRSLWVKLASRTVARPFAWWDARKRPISSA